MHVGHVGFPDKDIFSLKPNPDIPDQILDRFLACLPFSYAAPTHTVSSGRNLGFVVPDPKFDIYLSTSPASGLRSRSKTAPGSIFLRNSQRGLLMYGESQDHGVYLPLLMSVDETQTDRLRDSCQRFWETQTLADSKMVLSLDFTHSPEAIDIPSPNLQIPHTGNDSIDDATEYITQQTLAIWSHPPVELVEFLRFGQHEQREGTNGHVFPMQVVFSAVAMLFSNFSRTSPANFLHRLLEDCTDETVVARIGIVARFFSEFIESNLSYLRCVDTTAMVSVCEIFTNALSAAKTKHEVKVLTDAFCNFGTRMHGWIVYFFPYHFGSNLAYSNQASFLPTKPGAQRTLPISDQYNLAHSGFVKLLHRNPVSSETLHDQRSPVRTIATVLGTSDTNDLNIEMLDMEDGPQWHQCANYRKQAHADSVTALIPSAFPTHVDIYPKSHLSGLRYNHSIKRDRTRRRGIGEDNLQYLPSPCSITLHRGEVLLLHNLVVFRTREGSPPTFFGLDLRSHASGGRP